MRRKKKRLIVLQQEMRSVNQPSLEVELNAYESHCPKELEVASDDIKLKPPPIDDILHIYDELPPPLGEIDEKTVKKTAPPLPPANNPINPYSSIKDDMKKSLEIASYSTSSDEDY